eukprot:450724_1
MTKPELQPIKITTQPSLNKGQRNNTNKSCFPLLTMGCNDITGAESPGPGCPFIACCGRISPLSSMQLCPSCPEANQGFNMYAKQKSIFGYGTPVPITSKRYPYLNESARCICGCCISTPLCLLCYLPCFILSYFMPSDCISIGPCCWGSDCDYCGGKGYMRTEWRDYATDNEW